MSLVERVLNYLTRVEFRETDPWLRDDIRIAWLMVLFADRGDSDPFTKAHCHYLGVHPDNLQAAIETRRRAKLGSYYEMFHGTSSPKKPAQLERDPKWRKNVA